MCVIRSALLANTLIAEVLLPVAPVSLVCISTSWVQRAASLALRESYRQATMAVPFPWVVQVERLTALGAALGATAAVTRPHIASSVTQGAMVPVVRQNRLAPVRALLAVSADLEPLAAICARLANFRQPPDSPTVCHATLGVQLHNI